MIETMKCTKCGNTQPRDLEHPRTFLCKNCGHRFIYRIGVTGFKVQLRCGKAPLPVGELKKGVGLREYPRTLARMKKRGVTPLNVWEAGKKALDIQ